MKLLQLLLFAFTAIQLHAAADDTPAWLRTAAAEKAIDYGPKVPAAVLYREALVNVEESGRIVTTERYAVRILNRAGLREAYALKPFLRDSGKVRDLKGWVIAASGDSKKIAKERILEIGLGQDALYEDVRAKVIDAQRDCDPGAVFGYESVSEDKSIFTQLDWHMQRSLPTRLARFTLTTPNSWESKGIVINRPETKPTVQGTTSTWELRDLPFLDEEEDSPELDSIAPRIAVSLFPPGGTSPNHGPSFSNWEEVSRWLSSLHDTQYQPDGDITAKAASLTAAADSSEARIRALAEYVQGIRYVSIQTGLSRGGGYKPHSASTVFAKSYGDCKDKANLLRAMLKAANIESWPVSIYSGDPLYVRDEWPTPQQFNHCILAIRAPDSMKSEAIVESGLGRLLIFDPTDENTPFGQLPVHEQNSLALLMAPEKGGLLRMPGVQPETNRIARTIEAELSADGSVKGSLHEEYTGWPYTLARANFRKSNGTDYTKRLESRLTRGIKSAEINHVKPVDSAKESRFLLDVDFASTTFAQSMSGRLLVFRPSVLPAIEPLPGGRSKRQHPAVLRAGTWTDTVHVKIPGEYGIDEKPENMKFETPYGSYQSDCTLAGDVLTFTRTLTLKNALVPAAEFAKLNEFSEKVVGMDHSPVVLAKK